MTVGRALSRAMDEQGNFLEDFLTSLEMVPNDMRRNFELIRELDRQSHELSQELEIMEKQFLSKFQEKQLPFTDINADPDMIQMSRIRGDELI